MRTWDENKQAINELWPQHDFTDEQAKLWREDMEGLDQNMLYDAIKNASRKHDTPWVHSLWIRNEYRELKHAKKRQTSCLEKGEKLNLRINKEKEKGIYEQLIALIDVSRPSDYASIEKSILYRFFESLSSETARRLLIYAKKRFCLQDYPGFGKVSGDGDVEPIG